MISFRYLQSYATSEGGCQRHISNQVNTFGQNGGSPLESYAMPGSVTGSQFTVFTICHLTDTFLYRFFLHLLTLIFTSNTQCRNTVSVWPDILQHLKWTEPGLFLQLLCRTGSNVLGVETKPESFIRTPFTQIAHLTYFRKQICVSCLVKKAENRNAVQ